MMRWGAGRFAWALMGLWLAACGVVAPVDAPKDFATDYLEATCAWEARCGVIRDEAACVRDLRAMYQASFSENPRVSLFLHPLSGSLAAGRLRFDEDRARQCVTRLRELSCDSGEDPMSVFNDCDPHVGQRGAGEACLLDEECTADFFCDQRQTSADVCVAGTCAPRLGPGEQSTNGQRCARGLVLDSKWVCRPISGEGEPCSTFSSCSAGLSCDARTRTCRALGREGAACGQDTPCLVRFNCGDDGVCHRLADLGEACSYYLAPFPPRDGSAPVLPARLGCKTDLACAGATPTTRGTCRALPTEGERCSVIGECQYPARCVGLPDESFVCRALAETGASCESARCVPTAFCDPKTKTCAARGQKQGDACDESSGISCALGFRCEEGRCAPSYGGTCEG